MTLRSRTILKAWFKEGLKPTETQFSDVFDSFLHKSEDTLTIEKVEGLQEAIDSKQAIIGQENPNVAQQLEAPGNIVFITSEINNFKIAILTALLVYGDERILLTLNIPNSDTWVKENFSYNYPDLEDYDITSAIVDNKVQVTITFNTLPGTLDITKPQIQYF